MAIKVANYTFSSWLRKGIANRITEPDNLGAGATAIKERSHVPIDVMLNSEPVHKEFAIIGPGDILGINPRMVVRTEPLNWITNFEPNYLTFIEFYEEDFLWRYTPAAANDKRLRPWLALLVLKDADRPDDREFSKNERRLPLPSVTVKSGDSLPPHDQTWAWAHVHTNQGYENATEFEQFLLSLHDLNHPNADKIISRLLSPRKLDSDQAYRAFVVPAFETGRLAGLGQDVSNIPAQQPAWTAGAGNIEFPIYYEWYFRTGQNEDFESLVKILEPRPTDAKVGRRDMDGSKPGFGMVNGTDIGPIPPMTDNQMIIGLEGALRSPETKSKPLTIDTSKPFFHELESTLNFPADWQAASNTETDPVVCPPIYGENHALKHTIDVTGVGWLNELNRDPRHRVPSGFGVNVVQKNQEDYVARAWEQVKKILDANLKVRLSVFAMTAVQAIQTNFVEHLSTTEKFAVFSPVLRKVKGSPTTLFNQIQDSKIPPAALDTALRRLIRPRGAYGKRLRQADPQFSHAGLIQDLNEGKTSAAPPKEVPPSLITDNKLVDELPESKLPEWLNFLVKNRLVILIILLILLLFVALFTGAWIICALLAVAAVGGYVYAGRLAARTEIGNAIKEPEKLLADLKSTPPREGFAFVVSDPVVPITAAGATQVTTATTSSSTSPEALQFADVKVYTRANSGQDSLEAKNFRVAAINLSQRLTVRAPERVFTRFDVANAEKKLNAAIKPTSAFSKMVAAQVNFTFNPAWLLEPEHLIPAMAYPDFSDAMYAKLRDISSELFLPNLQLIPPNTISLLETNPPFIEAYMTGLNHEFGRELLWREYPTDQRGSYFRQFWEVKGIIAEDTGLTPEELADVYKDIEPLDQWPTASALGAHRNKKRPQGKQLVLVVRGELLKKYPNTIIYAQQAHIYKDKNGVDPNREPIIKEIKTEAEMKLEVRFPIFRAEIQPDFRFFGFDMTIAQAKGDDKPKLETDDWGWYFIIQQIPGEPRFGMDIAFDPDDDPSTPITWDDLGWNNYPDGAGFISTTVQPTAIHPTATPPVPNLFNKLTAAEKAQWGSHSADMAAVLYQKPVMIAVHAKEMLEKL
jgi:hypothetical protein